MDNASLQGRSSLVAYQVDNNAYHATSNHPLHAPADIRTQRLAESVRVHVDDPYPISLAYPIGRYPNPIVA